MFNDIFQYHFEFNQRLILELEKALSALPDRTFPLFCHVLNAHQIWNARILNVQPLGVNAVHAMETCKTLNRRNYADTLKILQEKDLSQTIGYQNSKGNSYSNTIQDILFHIANHSTHHKGQIITDFRQSGFEPLVTDYIFYKR